MAPKGWTNAAQRALFYDLLPTFSDHRAKRTLSRFWVIAKEKLFAITPMLETLYPGRTTEELDINEIAALQEAMELKKKVSECRLKLAWPF
jgi:hypothetical protein